MSETVCLASEHHVDGCLQAGHLGVATVLEIVVFDTVPERFTKTKHTPGRCIGSTKDWAVSSSYTQVIRWRVRCCRWCGAIANAVNGSG